MAGINDLHAYATFDVIMFYLPYLYLGRLSKNIASMERAVEQLLRYIQAEMFANG